MQKRGLTKAQKKKLDRDYVEILDRTGLYKPTSKRITPARAKRAEKLYKKYQRLLNPDLYFFKEVPKRAKRSPTIFEALTRKAKKSKITITKETVFAPKPKDATKARIFYDKRLEEWVIETKATSRNKRTGRKITKTETRPIATIDAIERMRDKLEKRFKVAFRKAGPRPGRNHDPKNKNVTFTVYGHLSNAMHFDSWDKMFAYLQGYNRSTDQHFIDLLSHVTIRTLSDDDYRELNDERNEYYAAVRKQRRGRGVNATGRSKR